MSAAAVSRKLAALGFPRNDFRERAAGVGFYASRGITCAVVVSWQGADTTERLTAMAEALRGAGYRCEVGARAVRVLSGEGWGS